MRIHRYLSCFVAPAMLFFAVSGAWQAFRFQDTRKDGTYTAPQVLKDLSEVHKAEHISGPAATVFRAGQVLVALSFIGTAIIGLVMAFRVSRPVWLVWLCIVAGIVLPALLFALARGTVERAVH
jgi:hypothetical protein